MWTEYMGGVQEVVYAGEEGERDKWGEITTLILDQSYH